MEINAVLIFGGNGTQRFSHIIANRALLGHEYVDMPCLLGPTMKRHSQEYKNREHRFGHINKVNKLRSKLPGQAFILASWLLNGRIMTTGR